MSSTLAPASERFETKLLSGREAIVEPSLIAALAALWAEAYRRSPVAAQREDPLYSPDNAGERTRRIRAELGSPSAVLAYLTRGADLVGFFWGLSVADLQAAEASKGDDVARFMSHDADRVAYLSMLGIHPDLNGRGLGKGLTRALCTAFAERGFIEAIARTINELALEKVYRPLGFEIHYQFRDPRASDAQRSIFGSRLPLAWSEIQFRPQRSASRVTTCPLRRPTPMSKLCSLRVLGVRVNQRGDWLFVRLETDAGVVGYGEVSHSGDDRAVARLLSERVAPLLIGQAIDSVGALTRTLERGLVTSCSSLRLRRTALSGTEHALWDVFARQLGVPVHALLGGALRSRVPLYANINRAIVDRSPQGFADAARQAVSDGFRAVKIAPFDGLSWREGQPCEQERLLLVGIARTQAVRAAIGKNVGLMVDCHGRFNRALALEVSRRLEPFDLAWLEDLIWRADDPTALAAIAPRIRQPLAGGEEELERHGIWQLLASASVSTLLPDVKHVGGLAEAKRIAELAEVARVWVAPHNPAGPIATRVSAELARTLPNLSHLEFAWGETGFRSALLDPPERVVEGQLELPGGPGFGVTLNERILAEHGFDPNSEV